MSLLGAAAGGSTALKNIKGADKLLSKDSPVDVRLCYAMFEADAGRVLLSGGLKEGDTGGDTVF